MLCAKCHERPATVHITSVDCDKVVKIDLCEQCARPNFLGREGFELTNTMELLRAGHVTEGNVAEEHLGKKRRR